MNIEAVTTQLLSVAMDAASLRQRTIASNIANHGIPGYQRLTVQFEEHLAQARNDLGTRGFVQSSTLSKVPPHIAADESAGYSDVRLDSEILALNKNFVAYQALIRSIKGHLGIQALAVSEGRG